MKLNYIFFCSVVFLSAIGYAYSQPSDEPYKGGLLEAVQKSDAIVEVKSNVPRHVSKNDNEFEIVEVLYGSDIKKGHIIRVDFIRDEGSLANNFYYTNRLEGMRTDTGMLPGDGHHPYFLLKKEGDRYWLIVNLDEFESLAAIAPKEILQKYLAIASQDKGSQAVELLKALLEMAEINSTNKDERAFPLYQFIYDWNLLKDNINELKARALINQAADTLNRYPGETIITSILPYMSESLKRSIVANLLVRYDKYMAEQKQYCTPENSPKKQMGGEMTVDMFVWMNKCLPPLDHLFIASILGIKDPDPDNPEPVISAAREFVSSGKSEVSEARTGSR